MNEPNRNLPRRPDQADLEGVDLAGANLEGRVLKGLDLRSRNLDGARLKNAILVELDLTGARLVGADLQGAEIDRCILDGANLLGASLKDAQVTDLSAKGANLQKVLAEGCHLEGGALEEADLSGAEFERAVLEDVDFTGASLVGAVLENCSVVGGSLAGVDLSQADLRKSRLVRVSLEGASLENIRARGLRIRGARGLEDIAREQLEAAGASVGGIWEKVRSRSVRKAPQEELTGTPEAQASTPEAQASTPEAQASTPEAPASLPDAPVVKPVESTPRRAWWKRFRRAVPDFGAVEPGASLAGVDWRGAQLAGRDLSGVDFSGAHLEGADLSGCQLGGACLDGAHMERARLSGASLVEASARGARMDDAVLRGADLRGFDASEARLVGADLRKTRWERTRLVRADLTAARLSDVDLEDAVLVEALLEQADLAGARLVDADVQGADVDGALGLSPAMLRDLESRGARLAAFSLSRLLGPIEVSRVAGMAAVVLVMTLGGYLAVRFISLDNLSDAELEGRARQDVARGDMEEALERYQALVERSETPQDRVLYTLEMVALWVASEDFDSALTALESALAIADTPDLQAEVGVRMAEVLGAADRAEAEVAAWEALTTRDDLAPDVLARSLVGLSDATARLGFSDRALAMQEDVLTRFPDNPSVVLAVNRSMAELLASRGRYDQAMAALERVEGFPLDDLQRMELMVSKARLLETRGEGPRSLEIYRELQARYPEVSNVDGKVLLSMAGLSQRQGDLDGAWSLLENLLSREIAPEVRGRALVLQGQVATSRGQPERARALYQRVVTEHAGDREVVEAARLALAQTMLSAADADAGSVLSKLRREGGEELVAQALLGQGRALAERGAIDEARQVFERVLDQETEGSAGDTARTQLAELLVREGKYPQAVRAYRALLAEATTEDQSLVLEASIADALLQGGRLVDAELAFESLLATHGQHPEASSLARLGLARVSESRGDHERARRLYRQVSREAMDPALRSEGLEGLAASHLDAGRDDEAMQAYRRFVEELPSGHEAAFSARMAMAGILVRRGESTRARQVYASLLDSAETPGRSREIRLALAELAESGGELEDALDAYQSLLQEEDLPTRSQWEVALGLARVHLGLGHLEAGLAVLERWKEEVDDATVRIGMLQLQVRALQGLGRGEEASELSGQLVEEAGDDEEAAQMARLEIAHEQLNRGEFEEAIAAYRAIGRTTRDRPTQAAMRLSVGRAQVAAGRADQARASYQGVLSEYSDLVESVFEAQMGICDADRLKGDLEAAARRYLEMRGPDVGSEVWRREQLAQVRMEQGQPEVARGLFEDILRDYPDHGAALATARNGLAGLLRGQGDLEQARGLYRQVSKSAADPALRDWARLHAAQIQFEQGQVDDAFFEMRRIEQESTDREVKLQAHLAMASIYLEKGRSDQALSLLKNEDASDLGPAWVASLAQVRVAAWLSLADFDAAEEEWGSVLAGFGEQQEAASQARLGLSEVARGRGEFEKAVGLADQVFSSSPDRFYQAQALLGKGRALGGAGDAAAAREVYQELMNGYPDQPEFIEAARQAQEDL